MVFSRLFPFILFLLKIKMHYIRARALLLIGSKPNDYIKKNKCHFFYACDKLFEMKIKNFLNVSNKINQPSYVLINK